MFAYPASGGIFAAFLPLGDVSQVPTGVSPALSLQNGAVPSESLVRAATGQAPSAIGTGFTLVIAAILLYLCFRRVVYFSSAIAFLGGVALLALFFPRITAGGLFPVLWELASGSALFFAAFVIGDRRYAPAFLPFRIGIGLFAAVLCVLLRRVAPFEQAACFAVLAANALTPLCGRVDPERPGKEEERDGSSESVPASGDEG